MVIYTEESRVKEGHVREGGVLSIRHSSACMAIEAMCVTPQILIGQVASISP